MNETKPAKRSTRARVGIVAGAMVVLASLAFAALHLPPVRRLALRWMLTRLEQSGLIARAARLDYNLATLRFHLSDVALARPSALTEPFFAASAIQVRLGWDIVFGRIVLEDVALDEPRVLLLSSAAGTNWPPTSSGPPRDASPPRSIRIEHARVTNLGVRWQGAQSSADLGVSFELTSGNDASGRIIATRPARISWRNHETSIQALDGRLSWNGSDLGVAGLALRLPEGTLRADGRIVALAGAPRLDAHVVADADLARLTPWFDLDRAVQGAARVDAQLTGPLAQPDATVALSGRDVAAAGVPPASIDASLHVASGSAELTSLRAHIAGGSITARGQAALDGPGAIRAEWHDIDLASLLRRALGHTPSLEPAAHLNGSLDGRWAAPRLEQLQLTSTARAVGNAAAPLPLDGDVTLELRTLRWRLSTDGIGTPGAQVSGSVGGSVNVGNLSRSSIDGSIHATSDDARRLVDTLARSSLIRRAADVSGTAAGDFAVGGTVGAPSFEGPLRARIQYESLPPAVFQARASIAPDGVDVREVDARLGDSSARGEFGWSRRSDALRGTIDASVAIHDLAGMSAVFPGRVPLGGRVGLSASLSGTPAHARATLAGSSGALDVAGQHFDRSSFDIGADFGRSRFVIDRLTMQSGAGRIEGRGDVDLTSNAYTAHLTATDVPIRPLTGVFAGSDAPISARLSGAFDGEGSFRDLGGRGHLSLADAHWKSADIGNVDADIALAGRDATVSIEARDLALNGGGTVGLDPAGALAFRGEWKPDDVAAVARRLALTVPAGGNGSAAVRFELNGTRDHLDELRGLLNVDALDVALSGQTIRLARAGQIEYDGRTARVTNIGLMAGSSALAIDGSIGDPASGGLTISLDGSLTDFAFVTQRPFPAGSVQLRLAASGPLAQPVITGTLQIADGRIPLNARQSVTDVSVNARLGAGVLTVDSAAASFEGARLAASARVPSNVIADRLPPFLRQRVTPAGGPATLSAQLSSITPAIGAPFVDQQTAAQIAGRVDASVQLEADRLALDRVRGTVSLDRADVSVAGISFDQRVPTRLTLRDGRLTVDAWEWGRDDNRIAVRGGATLGVNPSLDLVATAVIDLRVLNALTPQAGVLGRADAEIRVGGDVRSPTLDGWVTVSNGEARVANPRLVVSDVAGTVTLAADTLTFQRISATVNGGNSEIAGAIRHRWFTPLGGRITLQTNGAALDIEGLRAEANANIALDVEPGRPAVTGTVTLLRSSFREPLSLTSGLLRALQASPSISSPAASALDRLRLDVRIVTGDDLLVDNNYAQLSASADLRLVGAASRPSITGRATLGEGGSIFFGTRRYRLNTQGSVDFANPSRIEPDLNLSAVTRVQSTEITLALKGTPATLQTTLTSDNPQYTQSDLVSLLLVGRTASEAAAAGFSQSGPELLGYLSGEFIGTAGRALGLSTVRVESGSPDVRFDAGLVATETDPGARLTVGTNVGSQVEVVFSQSLHQSGALTWIVSYSPRSNINMRVVSLDSGDRIYDFRHDVTFGNPSRVPQSTTPRVRETVGSVRITGAGADEAAVSERLTLESGDRFSFFQWQDDRERIEAYFHEHDRLEARVITRRAAAPDDPARVNLVYEVRPGVRTTLQVEGFALQPATIREINRAWTRTVIDDLLQDEAVRIVRGALADEGYVLASVHSQVRQTADGKALSILIDPGQHAGDKQVRFVGNRGEPADRLLAVLSEPGLARAVWVEPDRARNALLGYYRANGYLNAAVRMDPISMAGGTAVRAIQVDEGEAVRVRAIRVEGARSLSPAAVIARAGLSRGETVTELKMDRAQSALDQSYRALGFNSVNVTLQSQAAPGGRDADLVVRVDEGRQQRLRAIATNGLESTNPTLVSRALKLDIGAPVNLAAWNAARRRLYETGAFRSVDIEREVMEEPAEDAAARGRPSEEPVRATINVQEWPRYRLRYGLELNDTAQSGSNDISSIIPSFEEAGRTFSLGVTGDVSARNLFGRAVSVGVTGRYTNDFRAARTYATLPTLFGRRIVTNLFLEQSHEGTGVTLAGTSPAVITDKTTLTLEQRVRPFPRTEISYGYTAEQNHTFDFHPDLVVNPFPFDVTATTSRLASSIIVDTRDDLIDATSGWFHASAVEYAPEALGSDLRFVRLLVQQRYYRRAGPVVLATNARLGLATAFDKTLLPTDRFFAGGGNSVRGYAEDALSPRDFLGTAVGGNALLVLNQEARFPLFPYVRGVAFFDAGRAFDEVGHLSLKDLSAGTGLGFRVQTPVVLLRFDVGVPLDPSFGPRRPRWFFSVGQSF